MKHVERSFANKLIELLNGVMTTFPQEIRNQALELIVLLEQQQYDESVLLLIYSYLDKEVKNEDHKRDFFVGTNISNKEDSIEPNNFQELYHLLHWLIYGQANCINKGVNI